MHVIVVSIIGRAGGDDRFKMLWRMRGDLQTVESTPGNAVMPTFPLHHCWAQAIRSLRRCRVVPVANIRRRARLRNRRCRAGQGERTRSSFRHVSESDRIVDKAHVTLRYGMASSTTGNTSATPSITTSVGRGIHIFADSFFPSLKRISTWSSRPLHRVFASCSYLLHASFSAGATHMLLTFHSARSRSPTATRASLDEMWARISTLPLVSIIL